jgi:hypothetical protein
VKAEVEQLEALIIQAEQVRAQEIERGVCISWGEQPKRTNYQNAH